MKFKKILSSFLAFAVDFGAVSFAPFGNNGSFLNSAIVAEAKTGNSATKMPDDVITFSSNYCRCPKRQVLYCLARFVREE